jgi:hypothetical protein
VVWLMELGYLLEETMEIKRNYVLGVFKTME